MDDEIPLDLLQAYSQGQITRRDIADRIGQEVGFGRLLGELHRHQLKLPRLPSDPQSPGVQLIRDLAARAAPHGR